MRRGESGGDAICSPSAPPLYTPRSRRECVTHPDTTRGEAACTFVPQRHPSSPIALAFRGKALCERKTLNVHLPPRKFAVSIVAYARVTLHLMGVGKWCCTRGLGAPSGCGICASGWRPLRELS